MNPHSSPYHPISSRHLAVAAESIAASQFALCGLDVLEQAGQAAFAYDLGVANPAGMLKVAVHASIGEYWEPFNDYRSPSQPAQGKNSFQSALDSWSKRHSAQVICLVHFDGLDLNRMPLIYLVSAVELVHKLHEMRNARSDAWQLERELGVDGFVTVRDLPSEWRLSAQRIAELMHAPAEEFSAKPRVAATAPVGALVAA